jgi:hypothetical protein
MAVQRRRGRPVQVPAAWLARVRAYWQATGKSLETLGIELASAMGDEQPLGASRVHQYISGKKTTDEMTRAFAQLMGAKMPVLGVEDPDIVAWCDVGQRLKEQASERFHEELAALTKIVETLEKLRRPR